MSTTLKTVNLPLSLVDAGDRIVMTLDVERTSIVEKVELDVQPGWDMPLWTATFSSDSPVRSITLPGSTFVRVVQ